MSQINILPLTSLLVVMLSGTPRQRGFQHGNRFADRIALAITRMKEGCAPASYRRARGHALRSWPELPHIAPHIVEEISGIAEGVPCDPIDLYCHIGFEFFEASPTSGCSGLAIATPAGAILGQNWDAPPEMHDDLALFLHIGDIGLELAMVASIGTLGWVGQNRFGLGLLTNDVMLDSLTAGIPSQVARRIMLGQRDVPSALEVLRGLPIMGGRCYILGDRAGTIRAAELSPRAGICELPPTPHIVHTNHALLKQTMAVESEAALQAVYPSSRMRLAALERAGAGAQSASDLMRVLADRTNLPDAVSKNVSVKERTRTAFSIIFDCGAGTFYLCDGPPAEGHYQCFHWPSSTAASVNAPGLSGLFASDATAP